MKQLGRKQKWVPGSRVDGFTIVERQPKGFLLRCDCGAERFAYNSQVSCPTPVVCRSCGTPKRNTSGLDLASAESLSGILLNYRKRAISKGWVFELTVEQFCELTRRDCHYCGAPPAQLILQTRYNGVDRKNPAQGYTEENCVPCCGTCNYAKRGMTVAEFAGWVDRIAQKKDSWSEPQLSPRSPPFGEL